MSAANPKDTSGVPLTTGPETQPSQVGEAEHPTTQERKMIMEELLLSVEEAGHVLGTGAGFLAG